MHEAGNEHVPAAVSSVRWVGAAALVRPLARRAVVLAVLTRTSPVLQPVPSLSGNTS